MAISKPKFTAIVFTILLTFNIAKAQSNVTRGSSLTPTGVKTSWLSPSGLFAFGFYPQSGGYAVGIYMAGTAERIVVWTAIRDALPLSNNATLNFTSDGWLSVEETPGKPIYISDSAGASLGSMQDSGNFVLYDSQGTILWQSFDNPTDTLLSGQRLVAGQSLFSSLSETDQSIGIFTLKMQVDGNLVLYPNVGTPDIEHPYWASRTDGSGANVTLHLESNGFLYLRNSTIIYNLTRGYPRKRLYRMRLDVDGIFRVYYHDSNGSVQLWQLSSDKCMGMGLCGVNGYCVITDNVAGCTCLPGLEVVNPESRSLGCHRNYTLNGCTNLDANMTTLDNAKWKDASYATPPASTQEECSRACLADCNCEVALFTNQECRLHKLPLSYVEVRRSEPSTIGLIKLYKSSGAGSNRLDPSPSVQVKKVRRVELLVIGVSLISFSVLILVISGVVLWRAQVWAYRKISEHVNNVELLEEAGPQAFTYVELEGITDGFREELGRGSFGIVYKGIIERSKKVVAVKKLKKELAQEGEQEFRTEMKVIGRTHHRNVARLLGSCCEGPERLLVYEYMKKGSLADILFENKRPCWEERMRMALDVAHGILYLHEECETIIIHCDIKPQNILMDEYGCAKISDFGLAKLLQHDQTKTFTLIRGTRGYVAPEWYKELPITVKVDVYSFGILLFEIVCCRRCVDNSLPVEKAILVEWVYDCYEVDQVSKLVDGEDVDESKLEGMIRIGLWCVQEDPSLRPSMKEVVLMLEGTVKIPVPPNPASFLTLE